MLGTGSGALLCLPPDQDEANDREDIIIHFLFLSLPTSFAQAKASGWSLRFGIQIREDCMFAG